MKPSEIQGLHPKTPTYKFLPPEVDFSIFYEFLSEKSKNRYL